MPRIRPDNLPDFLEDARRQLRRGATARGLALTIVSLVGGLLLAGGIDFLARSNSAGLRLLLALLAFLPAILVASRWLLWPWATRLNRLDLARRIERADPSWRGVLTSATAFFDPRGEYGSPRLQRRARELVESRIAESPAVSLIDVRRLRHIAVAALAAFLVGATVVVVAPRSSGVALARLAQPWARIEWPRRVHLAMVDDSGRQLAEVLQIGQGRTFRFFVRNTTGRLPEDLTLEVQGSDGRSRREPLPLAEEPPPGIEAPRVGVASLFAEAGTIRFRVVGGDDRNMPFATAHVVVPPRLEDLEITVTPPAYLNEEPVTAPAGVTRVRGVLGSQVTIGARANKPLAEAELFVGDEPAPRPTIGGQGRELTASFILANERPSSYWFRLRDDSGFENPDAPRYEISTQIDMPPEVVLKKPAGDLTATPRARLPLAVEAGDDHGLTGVRIRYGRGRRLPDLQSTDTEREFPAIPLLDSPPRPREHSGQFEWSLEPLGLAVGDALSFRAEATDAYDLGPPRIGMSSARTMTIVSPEAKREELLDRQAALLSELADSHRATRDLRDSADSLADELTETNQLRAGHRDRLARTELEQRGLGEHLAGPRESRAAKAEKMLAEVDANTIDDPALRRRLEMITRELATLRDDALKSADRHMTDARKATEPNEAAGALRAAHGDLGVVQDGLESLLDELGAWRNRRNLLAEIRDLLDSQQSLTEETAQTAGQTLGTATSKLTDEQSVHLEQLSTRQSALADRLEQLKAHLESHREADNNEQSANDDESRNNPDEKKDDQKDRETESTGTNDPLLREAANRLQSAGLAGSARSAGREIRDNHLGEAGEIQSDLLDELAGLRNLLAEQKPAPADNRNFQELRDDIDALSREQEELVETLRKHQKDDEPMTDSQRRNMFERQGELRRSTSTAARTARRAEADETSRTLSRAAAAMNQGAERLRREEDRQAEQNLEQALDSLRQARERMEQQQDDRQGPLAETIPASLRADARTLAERQESLNEEVNRLDTLVAKNGSLSRSQLLTLRDIQKAQTTLADETDTLGQTADDAPVVRFALRSAAKQMRLLADDLDRRDTGPTARQAGKQAAARLRELVAAIETADETNPKPTKGGVTDGQSGPKAAVSQLAQLELLRVMQQDLRRRTRELESNQTEGADDRARAVEAIGRELAAIRDLVVAILPDQPSGRPTEEEGEAP